MIQADVVRRVEYVRSEFMWIIFLTLLCSAHVSGDTMSTTSYSHSLDGLCSALE